MLFASRLIKWVKDNPIIAVGWLVIGLFCWLRIWRLNLPNETVFDEVYFPKMASQYLAGEDFFDIHPPLGKLLIALAELAIGNNTVGWRLMPLISGIAILAVGYWVSWQIFQDKKVAWLTSIFLAIDGLFIVYSRTSLMDGFMVLFGLAAVGFAWRFKNQAVKGQFGLGSMLMSGTMAGLALAIKWIGAGFLPIVAIFTGWILLTNKIVASKNKLINHKIDIWLVWLISFVVLPLCLYVLPFLANWQSDFWSQLINWHQQSWNYNVNLDATHPYASKWWSWPFLIRPIWFYYQNVNGQVIGVDAIGNPILWWGSTLAVVYTILVLIYSFINRHQQNLQVIEKRYLLPLSFTLMSWAVFYLPWVGVGRVLFLYHYLVSYLFALLLGAFWLGQALNGRLSRLVSIIALGVAIIVSLAFVPIWIAYPIPQVWFDKLMWFTSWI